MNRAKNRGCRCVLEMRLLRLRCCAPSIGVLALPLALLLGCSVIGFGQNVSTDDSFVIRLRSPMVTVMEGQSLRRAVDEIAGRSGLNVWLDRDVDPSAAVAIGQVGPTVFDALAAIASERECEIFPLRNVVLLGRRERVDRTAASLMRLDQHGPTESIEVAWPELTTPTEALIIASGRHLGGDNHLSSVGGLAPSPGAVLPHDLWPAVRWRGVERAVAVTLVAAQFDQRLSDPRPWGRQQSLELVPADLGESLERRYARPGTPDPQLPARWRESIRQADPNGQVIAAGTWLVVQGTTAAHRVATRLFLESLPAAQVEHRSPDFAPRFTLQLKNKPAGGVLHQLAAAAGKRCQIKPEAEAASETLVSLDAENVTLAELADRVAAQAGLVVIWDDEVIVHSSR